MAQNPYAAPVPYSPPGAPPQMAPGAAQPWSVGEVLGHGWAMFQRYWATVLFAPMVGGIIIMIPWYLMAGLAVLLAQLSIVLGILVGLVAIVMMAGLAAYISVGIRRIYLTAARGEEPQFNLLFSGADRILPSLGTGLLVMLAVMVGMMLCAIPGYILAFGLALAGYYAIDTEMGVMESLQASWEATDGHKFDIFLLALASGLVMMAGALACGLGTLVAAPVVAIANATVYLRLSGRGAVAPAGYGMAGPPQGLPPGAGAFGAGYAQQPGGFGGPQAGYGAAPQAGFGTPAPQGGFGAPQGGAYGAPPQGAPPAQGGYGAPPQGAPQGGYGAPPQGAPQGQPQGGQPGGQAGWGAPPPGGGAPGGAPQGGGWGDPNQGGGGQPPPGGGWGS